MTSLNVSAVIAAVSAKMCSKLQQLLWRLDVALFCTPTIDIQSLSICPCEGAGDAEDYLKFRLPATVVTEIVVEANWKQAVVFYDSSLGIYIVNITFIWFITNLHDI